MKPMFMVAIALSVLGSTFVLATPRLPVRSLRSLYPTRNQQLLHESRKQKKSELNFLTWRGGHSGDYNDYKREKSYRRNTPGGDNDNGITSSYAMNEEWNNNQWDPSQTTLFPPEANDYDQQQDTDTLNYPPDDTAIVDPPSNSYGMDEQIDKDPFFSETVQDRVDRWKSEQREQALLTAQKIPNSAYENASLVATVSRGSRALVFFILMWRDIHLFEVADQALKKHGLLRTLLVTPLVFLFVGNLIGAISSMSSSDLSHSTKRRLKAILNADKFVEMVLIIFYIMRLTVAPSKHTPREIYVANLLHSFIFLLQSHAFTRVSWGEKNQHPPTYTKLASGTATNYGQQQQPTYSEQNWQTNSDYSYQNSRDSSPYYGNDSSYNNPR